MRALARVLLALLLVVVATSAWVRLAQGGLACGAQDCYATKGARAAAEQSTGVAVARTLHRISASAAGAVILGIAFLGWRDASAGQRSATVALGVLAIALATLGQFTPSPLPAVTLGNLLGGMTMAGLAAWLARSLERRPDERDVRALRPWAWLAVALVALQVASGGMVAARQASFACDGFPLCGGKAWPAGASREAFDPLRASVPPATAEQRATPERQALVIVHRGLAVPALLLLAWLGVRATRAGSRPIGSALVGLAALHLALGIALALGGATLGLAVAHNVAAALTAVMLAALLAPAPPA